MFAFPNKAQLRAAVVTVAAPVLVPTATYKAIADVDEVLSIYLALTTLDP